MDQAQNLLLSGVGDRSKDGLREKAAREGRNVDENVEEQEEQERVPRCRRRKRRRRRRRRRRRSQRWPLRVRGRSYNIRA
eukprot:764457-Hanusia_phi.AAC.3